MNLKIWHKMIIGISIPSFIVLIGGIFTYQYIKDVKMRHGFVEIADDLKEQVLEVRRNEKNFLLHKSSEYFKYCQDAINISSSSIKNVSSEIVEQIGKEEFSLLRNSIQTYSSSIYELLENYRQEAEIIEQVREEGRKLEASVATGKHAQELSTNFILNLRRWEKNYMLFRDKASFDKLNSTLSQLRNVTPFCIECIQYVKTIQNLFLVYNKNDLMANDLQVIGNKLEEITGRIAKGERQKVRSFFIHTQRFLLTVLILICTIGPLLVYKTATYIVAPIKRLADITKKISEGDLNLRAPLKEHDETYTLAQSFNTMLDHLQLTHESLEKSLMLLHEKQKESEKRVSLGLLVSGVAHELNNPLNNISLTSETLKEDLKDMDHEQMQEYINDILTQCERAQDVVKNLLNFAGTRKSSEMIKLDITKVAKESIHLIANQLKVTNISLIENIPDKPFYVNGSLNKLEEIFVNIMVNAIHAMKEYGNLTVSVEPDAEYENIFIKISDTGCGIPEKDLKNIFEPFYTTKPVGEGTGLGLSVAHNLIMEHNGTINVKSRINEGTMFIISLPLYEDAGVL